MGFDPVVLCFVILIGALWNLLGKLLLDRIELPRLLCWGAIFVPFVAAHLILLDEPVVARVVGLCVVLLLGMKLIIYQEWLREGKKQMPYGRWLLFSFCWFGMEPRPWVGNRKKLEWNSHVKWGMICIGAGLTGITILAWYGYTFYPLTFVYLSMLLHFGVLRLLVAFWRWYGFPVRTLFRNPLVTKGFADFWGARWNLAYSQMMARAVQRPLVPLFGQKGAIFAVFVVSGLFHELAITVPAMSGFGFPTIFFVMNGLAVLVEEDGKYLRYACLLALIVGLPTLFPVVFAENVIIPIQDLWSQMLRQ